MHVVKSVGVLSVAKIMGLLYGCMGLIIVPFFLLAGFAGMFASNDKAAFPFAGLFGIVFAILAPFLYGGMGFVFGAIGALIYNVVAKWVGGFELELTLQPPPLDFNVQRPLVPPPPQSI
jgi:hypothetical protein